MADDSPARPAISWTLTVVLAVACGVSAANLYYAQPLLHTIAADFSTGSGSASLIVTLGQVGYAVGLALLVPLGDLLPRRRLVPAALVVVAVAMAASSAAPDLAVLILLAALVGVGSVAAQILVPLAATLADDESRGRVVGTVMSGLLLGILLARTVAGLVAGVSSWRVVYASAAILVVLLAAVLARVLPPEGERPPASYGSLLTSTVRLFAGQPLVRRRAALGGLTFGAFSVLWTTVAFLLAGGPYHYSDTVIGLFGLVGAAGALCANFAGKLADRDRTAPSSIVFALAMLGSFGLLYLGRHSLGWLVAGIALLDIGTQGMQITNQSLIYGVGAEYRSRVTSSYMVCYFAGGAIASAVAGTVYASSGWAGVCVTGGAIGAVATVVAVLDALSPVQVRPVRAGGASRGVDGPARQSSPA